MYTARESLRDAVENRNLVTFHYHGSVSRMRAVRPLEVLVTSSGDYVLKARELDTGSTKSFRIDRMSSVCITPAILSENDTLDVTVPVLGSFSSADGLYVLATALSLKSGLALYDRLKPKDMDFVTINGVEWLRFVL